MKTFVIRWISTGDGEAEPTFIEAEDLAGAIWEATRRYRSIVKSNRRAVVSGLYGCGFKVEEA